MNQISSSVSCNHACAVRKWNWRVYPVRWEDAASPINQKRQTRNQSINTIWAKTIQNQTNSNAKKLLILGLTDELKGGSSWECRDRESYLDYSTREIGVGHRIGLNWQQELCSSLGEFTLTKKGFSLISLTRKW